MCTHEIWTYSECDCRYDHHITCFDALADREREHSEPKPSRNTDKQSSTSPVKLPPSPSPTDSEDEEQIQQWRRSPQRSCSVNRTVHKTFLEPICHDCLIAELTKEQQTQDDNTAPALHSQSRLDNNLIWDSDVKIEVGGSTGPSPRHTGQHGEVANESDILKSDVEARISDSSRRRSLIFPNFSRRTDEAREPSAFSTEDADSESSAPSTRNRGRHRVRSKQLRRMAMDVSREDLRLRVSSRWPSFQQKSLQSFREELQRGRSAEPRPVLHREEASPSKRATVQPLKSFMQRLTDAHGDKWLKAKDAVNDLGRKIGRGSPSPKRHHPSRHRMSFGIKSPIHKQSLTKLKKEIVDYNRAVDASSHSTPERPTTGYTIAPESFYLQPNDPFYPVIQPSGDYTTHLNNTLPHTPVETWRMHLEQDLTTPRQRKHRPVLCSPLNDDVATFLDGRAQPVLDVPERVQPSVSTSTTAVSTSTTSGNWQSHPSIGSNPFSHKSYQYSATHEEEVELKRRLLSASTLPSMLETAASEPDSIDSTEMQGHRIASLVSDGDFDQPNDQDLTVGSQNIEREMAMVGLTENPWRQAILSSAGLQPSGVNANASGHDLANGSYPSGSPSTPPSLTLPLNTSPSTAIRARHNQSPSRTSRSQEHIVHQDLTTLSGLANTVTLRHHPNHSDDLPLRRPQSPTYTPLSHQANPQKSPSPSPSPATPHTSTNAHHQLALHALSTPFHHSLAPKPSTITSQESQPSTQDLTSASRPRSAPQPISIPSPSTHWRTIAHTSQGQTTPEAAEGFALGMKSPGVAGLFGCVWVRELCPGQQRLDGKGAKCEAGGDEGDVKVEGRERHGMDEGGSFPERSEGGEEGDDPAACGRQIEDLKARKQGLDQSCGRVTGWRVRSCLCTGRVRTVSAVTVAEQLSESVGRGGGGGGLPAVREEEEEVCNHAYHSKHGDDNGRWISATLGDVSSEGRKVMERGAQSVEEVVEGRLDAECRSVAPVVRYVVGEELCAGCRRRRVVDGATEE